DSIESGDITYKDVLKVQPFTNELVYVDFKGSEVLPYLQAAANMKPASGAYAQFYNVSLTVNPDGSNSDVKIDGKPVDPEKTYRM
ncbi:5'-nucleotidase C-terminal domain-containing protein, partial [Vibrio parahaemolyticus]|uniref:5'-nucleotidase C-terminal domain-containing protein n=1 Tax=Vibrio parahaemolyticus TaxID=670 RepID=UPI001A8F61D0